MPDVCAVFPVYNEAPLLPDLIGQAREALKSVGSRPKIVLVDDGSTDESGMIMQDFAANDPLLKLVIHDVNRGYGAAVKNGLAAADADYIFFSDSDLQFDLFQISRLTDALQGSEDQVAVGYRSPRADPWPRMLLGRFWTVLVRLTLGIKARDVNCAFKLMSRSARDALRLEALTVEGPAINAALFHRWKLAGMGWTEVPVSHLPRPAGNQTGGSIKAITTGYRELMNLRRLK